MKKTLLSIGIGAGIMYLLDPELGPVRRSMLADKLRGVAPRTSDAVAHKAEALSAKAHDLSEQADARAAEAIESLPVEPSEAADAVDAVAEKIEAKDLDPAA